MVRLAKFCCLSITAVLIYGTAFNGTAAAGPFSDLVVFGDSLSDMGNVSRATFGFEPGNYYWNGRFSNGPVYAESLATGLGLPPLTRSTSGGGDFAYGGAQTTGTGGLDGIFVKDVDEQVNQFETTRTANANTLYLIFAGANDLIYGQTNVSVPLNNLSQDLSHLFAAGARNFLVFNLPLLGYTPRYNGSQATLSEKNSITQQFNASLSTMLDSFESSNPSASVYRLDVATLVGQAIADPQSFGLVNVTTSAAPGLQPGATTYDTSKEVPNPNQYLFWDDLHPTAAVHAILGQRAVQLFYEPGDFNHDSKVDAADYLVWRKGVSAGFIQSDYDVWRSHFGQTDGSRSYLVGAASVAMAVPEPATLGLALLAVCCIAGKRANAFSSLFVSVSAKSC